MTGNSHATRRNMSGDSYRDGMSDGNSMPSDEPYYERRRHARRRHVRALTGRPPRLHAATAPAVPDGCCDNVRRLPASPLRLRRRFARRLLHRPRRRRIVSHRSASASQVAGNRPLRRRPRLQRPVRPDRDSGNFGFQEGINFGAKIPFTDWVIKIGTKAPESQLSGDADSQIDSPFTQHFWTTGVPPPRDGLQGGLAWDLCLIHATRRDFHQLRGELSFVDPVATSSV